MTKERGTKNLLKMSGLAIAIMLVIGIVVMLCLYQRQTIEKGSAQYNNTDGEIVTIGEYRCEICDDGTLRILDYTGSSVDLEIPSELGGRFVTVIGVSAFDGSNLKSVKIPNGVTRLEIGAFNALTSLEVVELPSSLISIGEYSFDGCTALKTIVIPESVKTIDVSAFRNCTALETVYFSIPFINLPIDVNNIFEGCNKDKLYLILNRTNGAFLEKSSDIERYARTYDIKYISYFDSSEGRILYDYCTYEENLSIPREVDKKNIIGIGQKAFYGDQELKTVTIPYGITSIGAKAFNGCSNLEQVIIPSSVDSIQSTAFDGCDKLCIVTKSTNNTVVGYAVNNNIDYMTYEYNDNEDAFKITKYVGDNTFLNVPSMIYGEVVDTIAEGAFNNCTSLREITIPAPGYSYNIGSEAFGNCSNLEKVIFTTADIDFGENVFVGCDNERLYLIYNGVETHYDTLITSYAREHKIKYLSYFNLGDGTIEVNRYLTWESDVVIPSTIEEKLVTSIGENAISGVSELVKLTIPEGIIAIGERAFSNQNLEIVIIPNSVTSIATNAFENCEKVCLVAETNNRTVVDYATNNGIDCMLYFEFEVEIEGENETQVAIDSYMEKNNTTLNIPSEINGKAVTKITAWAFEECEILENVSIPETVTEIEDYAFYKSTSLSQINIPDGVTVIGIDVFHECTNLATIEIPEEVTSIESGAFAYTAMQFVNIPSNVETIAGDAFIGCQNLKGIAVDSNNQNFNSLNGILFNKDLTKIIICPAGKVFTNGEYGIPESVTSIGEYAFARCNNLKKIFIHSKITTIENNAFWSCENLENVIIHNSVEEIGNDVFTDCKNVKIICRENSTAHTYADNKGIEHIIDESVSKPAELVMRLNDSRGNIISSGSSTNNDVYIKLTNAEDDLSGIESARYMVDFDENQATVEPTTLSEASKHTIHVLTVDNLGNQEVLVYTVTIDKTAPTVTVGYIPSDYSKETDVTITVEDEGSSGLDETNVYWYNLTSNDSEPDRGEENWVEYVAGETLTLGETLNGEYYLYVLPVLDNAGNRSTDAGFHKYGPYKFDNTAPTVEVSLEKTADYCKNTEVTITVADEGGSELASTNTYKYNLTTNVDEADEEEENWNEYESGKPITLEGNLNGEYYLYVRPITDNAGNVSGEVHKYGPYKFDNTAPTVEVSLEETVDYCKNTEVTITVADEGGSELVSTNTYKYNLTTNADEADEEEGNWNEYVPGEPLTLGENLNGEYYLYVRPITDNAGNVSGEAHKYGPYKFDNTAPTVEVSLEETADYCKNTEVTITVADEGGSELVSTSTYKYNLTTNADEADEEEENWNEYVSGEAITLGGELSGEYYLYVKAITDNAGNVSGEVHRYGPYKFDNTEPTIEALDITYGESADITLQDQLSKMAWWAITANNTQPTMRDESATTQYVLNCWYKVDKEAEVNVSLPKLDAGEYYIWGEDSLGNRTNQKFTVNKRQVTITAEDQTIEYGETISSQASDATLEGALSGHEITSIQLTTENVRVTTSGEIEITENSIVISDSQGNNVTGNYEITDYKEGKLTINPKAVIITAEDQTIEYGETISSEASDATLEGALSGHEITSIQLTTENVNVTTNGKIEITENSIEIKDSQGNDVTGNYAITYVDGTLTILKASPILTLDPQDLAIKKGTEQTATITYTGDGNLSVGSSNTGVATATLNGRTITVEGLSDGMSTITVNASAGANYNEAQTSISVEVNATVPDDPTVIVKNSKGETVNSNEWSNDDLEITIEGSAAEDVVYQYSYDYEEWTNYTEAIDYSTETKGQAFYARAYDTVSEIGSTPIRYVIKIDKTAPTVNVSPEEADCCKSISVNIRVEDGVSGLAENTQIQYAWSTSETELTTALNTLSFVNGSGDSRTSATITREGLNGTYYLWIQSEKIEDIAGNSSSINECYGPFIFDNEEPTVTISANKPSTTNAEKITYTFRFSEAVTGFDKTDITVTNGTIGTFTGNDGDIEYTLEVAYVADGEQTVQVAADVAHDSVGNGNTASATSRVTIDRTAPTIEVSNTMTYTEEEVRITLSSEGVGKTYYYAVTTSDITKAEDVEWQSVNSQNNSVTLNLQLNAGNYRIWTKDSLNNISSRVFEITKARPEFSVSPTNVEIDKDNNATATITYNGDGTLSVQSSDTGVATVTLNGKIIAINGRERGNATITVKVTEGTNYTLPTEDELTIEVTVNAVYEAPTLTVKDASNNTISSGNWSRSNLTITIDGSTIPGEKEYEYSYDRNSWTKYTGAITYSEETAGKTIYARAKSGTLTSEVAEYVIKLDKTAPTVAVTPETSNYCKNTDVTINVADQDGSGLATTNSYEYNLSTSPERVGETWITYQRGRSIKLGENLSGTYYLYVRPITDNAGNTSGAVHKFGPYYFDNTAPSKAATMTMKLDSSTGADYSEGAWTKHSVYIALNNDATDAHSGVEETTYTVNNGPATTEPQTLTESGEYLIKITTKDKVGLTKTREYIVKIDKQAPTITDITSSQTGCTDETVTLTITGATDNLSGLSEIAYSFDAGTSWQTDNTKVYNQSTNGIVIKVRDNAGNVYTHEEINISIGHNYVDGTCEKCGDEQGLYINSEKYEIEESYITKVQEKTTVEDFKYRIETNASTIIICNKDGEELSKDDFVTTGSTLEIKLGNQTMEYTIIVSGDVDGDGYAKFSDMLEINRHRLGRTTLQGANLLAADVTKDGMVNFKDLVMINKFRLGKVNAL